MRLLEHLCGGVTVVRPVHHPSGWDMMDNHKFQIVWREPGEGNYGRRGI
jgi:hypothetical protein